LEQKGSASSRGKYGRYGRYGNSSPKFQPDIVFVKCYLIKLKLFPDSAYSNFIDLPNFFLICKGMQSLECSLLVETDKFAGFLIKW